MTVEWNGAVIMRTSPHFRPRPITLNAGTPSLISGDDLCIYRDANAIEFSGYSRENYERTKALPEGAYKISFAAFDYQRQNVQVSNAESNIFFLQKKNPPLLNSPVCNSRVQKQDPQFLVFNWSSVNTPSFLPGNETEYVFSLFEIIPKNSNPNYIVRSSRPIYTTVTQSNTLSYGPGEPALLDSMEYAWTVQARSRDGRDLYSNQGYSIPCKFTYATVNPFDAQHFSKPTVFAEAIHERAAKIWWPLSKRKNMLESYRAEYRGAANEMGEFPWHIEERETDSVINIHSLDPDREYDVRLCWKIRGFYGPYSDIVKFRTPPHQPVKCGDLVPAPPPPAHAMPLRSANAGMVIKIKVWDILLTEVSGGNGVYSGKGKIVNQGFGFGMAMEFKDIFINSDLVVVRGNMSAERYPIDEFIKKKLDKQHGGGDTGKPKTGDIIPEFTTALPILSADDIKTDTVKGTVTIKDRQTGKEEVICYKERKRKLPLAIEDKDGNLYHIDKSGKATPAGKRGAAGSAPPLAVLNALNLEEGKVVFGPGRNNKYAFDAWNESYANAKELLVSRYENLNGYRVSAKAIAPGEQETVTARLEKPSGSTIDPSQIKFVSGKGIIYPSVREGNNFTVTVTGGPADDAQEIFARVRSRGKDVTIGKLLVASYAPVQKKLILVPVGELRIGLQEAVAEGMRKSYAPITVNYAVEADRSFSDNKEWDKNGDGILQDGKTPFLSNDFTGEEKALVKAYKKTHRIDKEAVYLFAVNETALRDGDLLGKMPRQSQFGFLFVKDASAEDIARAAAHEVGHGAYTLSHTFSAEVGLPQGVTRTLMDYSTGYDLLKFQWDIVHQPGNVWGVFEGEEEGEYSRSAHFALTPSGDVADEFFVRKDGREQEINITAIISDASYCIEIISYESERYEWDAGSKTYKNGGKSIYFKKKEKPLNKVNLFKPIGDGCQYYYTLIKWTDADAGSGNTAQTIASKITSKTEWIVFPYSLQKPACAEKFLKDVDGGDKQCAKEDIDKSDRLLQQHASAADAAPLADAINSSCLASLRKLSYAQQIKFFKKIAAQAAIKDKSEMALIRLMNAMDKENYAAFYADLERNSNELIKHLTAQMHDASIYPWRANNYTNFIGALVFMFSANPNAYINKFAQPGNEKLLTQVINLNPQYFKSDIAPASFGMIINLNEFKLIGVYNKQTGTIRIVRQQRVILTAADAPQVFWNDVETFADGLSPLTPIIIAGGKDLPLVQTALGVDNQPADAEYIVPAVFLKYKGDKEFNDEAIKAGMLVIDAGSMAASGGLALATKVRWARRLWALAEVAAAAGNIGLNVGGIAPDSNLGKALGYYNVAMALIGVKNAGRGLYHYAKELPAQTKNLLNSNGNLKALLRENHQNFKTSLSSAKGEKSYAELDDLAKEKLRKAEGMFDDLMGGAKARKTGLLNKFENFANIKLLINGLDEVADLAFINKLDDFSTSAGSLKKLDDLLNAPKLKQQAQAWDNLESVFDALKRAEDKNIAGISLKHKKFPASADEGSSAYILKNAKQYQQEASGDAALSFEKGGVSWDNLDEAGKLVDRKYGHGNSIFQETDNGVGKKIISVKNKSRERSIIAQARSQVTAAGGTPIKWEISTDLGARGIRELFSESANSLIRNIEVVHVPQVTVIP